MNNFIEYFYGIKIEKIMRNDKYYFFYYKDNLYRLYTYDGNEDNIHNLYNINKNLIHNTLMSEIIINKDNKIISYYTGVSYVLIKVYANINKQISLEEINFISQCLYKDKIIINWGFLWSKKIDYLEELINENGKKYPLIVDSFNYFVGMCENAISYFNSVGLDNNYKYSISHKSIRYDDTVECLYNPLNIIFDYRVRDIAEYIKNSFFSKNYYIYDEVIGYINNNNLSLMEVKILISRLLYPSFYFELYEDILIDNKDEKIIVNIISKLDDYEIYLDKIISLFKNYYDIEVIDWLKK